MGEGAHYTVHIETDKSRMWHIGYTPRVRAYLVSRLAQTALVVFLSLTAVFFLVRLSGDPVLLFLPMDIQAKDINEFRQRLGFNDPLPVQYGRFLSGAVRGDFGESLRYRRDAMTLVLERLPATLELGLAALLLAFSLSIPIGILSATHRGTLVEPRSMPRAWRASRARPSSIFSAPSSC